MNIAGEMGVRSEFSEKLGGQTSVGAIGAAACAEARSLHVGYFNYQDGGHVGSEKVSDDLTIYHYDYQGLVDVAGQDNEWPDILVMGEGNYYGLNDETGAKGAAQAMQEASRRPYKPLVGCLPREWGPFAPVVFVDTQVVDIERWYHPKDPDFAARHRNRLIASMGGSTDTFNIIATHGDTDDGDMRLADAKKFKKYGGFSEPSIIVGDWFCVPSGPMWEPHDLNDRTIYPQPGRSGRILWEHGLKQGGPSSSETRSLDFLLGYWQPNDPNKEPIAADGTVLDWGHRIEGARLYDAAELFHDTTPTQYRPPESSQRSQLLAYDRILLNEAARNRIKAFRVRPPLDPHPSDHLMVEAIFSA